MAPRAEPLLPNGDYIVQRTELRSARVMLVHLPDALTPDEAKQVARELRHLAEAVESCGGALSVAMGNEVN